MRVPLWICPCIAIAVLGGCRKPAKLVLTKDQRARIQENILQEAPTPKVPLNANFGDNIRLIGVDLSADRVKPGETMSVTYYWECLRETPGDWKVFVHLELPGGRRMILDHHPVGELYPIANWKRGEIIKDTQRFAVPADVTPGAAVIWAGLFNETIYREQGGGDRMELVNKAQVPNDGENRVRAAQFVIVKPGEARSEPRLLLVKRTTTEIKIDGDLNEEAWISAKPSEPFLNSQGEKAPDDMETFVRGCYDDKFLYLAFSVRDKAIESPYKNRDDELWNADAIEVFLDAGLDGKDYLEIQVSPLNVVFDAKFASRRSPQWQEAKQFNLNGLLTAVRVKGTPNQPDDDDVGYDVEMAIPLAEIPGLGKVEPGAELRANFFRVEARGGQVVDTLAFSPAGSDFHDLDKAGLIKFDSGPPIPKDTPQVITPQARPEPVKPPEILRRGLRKTENLLRKTPLSGDPPRNQ